MPRGSGTIETRVHRALVLRCAGCDTGLEGSYQKCAKDFGPPPHFLAPNGAGVSFSGNSNGELIPSGPFAVITNTDDIIVITQEDIDAGLCTWDYTTVYAAYQDGVRTGSNPTGVYFYAYPVYENTDVENREFYSLM